MKKIRSEFWENRWLYLTSIFSLQFFCAIFYQEKCKEPSAGYDDLAKEISLNTPELNFTYTVREFQIDADTFDENHYQYVGPSINRPDRAAF